MDRSSRPSMLANLDIRATACAERLCEASSVLVVSHIDADGLTSAAVAATALERADIESDDETPEPERKVSARGTNQLVQQGLNLAVVMNEAAEAVGGGGGGHDVAAGATIPAGCELSFVKSTDQLVAEQLR